MKSILKDEIRCLFLVIVCITLSTSHAHTQPTSDFTITTVANLTHANINNTVIYTTTVHNISSETKTLTFIISSNDGVQIASDAIASDKSSATLAKGNTTNYTIKDLAAGGTLTLTFNGTIRKNASFLATVTTTITGGPSSAVSVGIRRNVNLQIVTHEIIPEPLGSGWNPTDRSIVTYETTIINYGEDDVVTSEPVIFSIRAVGIDINLNEVIITPPKAISVRQSNNDREIHIIRLTRNTPVTFRYTGRIDANNLMISSGATIALSRASNVYNNEYNDKINHVYVTHTINGVPREILSFSKNIKEGATIFPRKDISLVVIQQVDKNGKDTQVKNGEKVRYTTTIANHGIRPTKVGLGVITLTFMLDGVIVSDRNIENAINNALKGRTDITIKKDPALEYTYIINNIPEDGSVNFSYDGQINQPKDDIATLTAEMQGALLPNLPISPVSNRQIVIENSNSGTARTWIVKNINLKVENTVANPTTPQPIGATVNYTTVITNNGPNEVAGITLILEPDGVQIDPIRNRNPIDNLQNTYHIGNSSPWNREVIAPGGSIILTYTGRIISQSKDATVKATVTHSNVQEYRDIGTLPADKTSTATTIIKKAIDLRIVNKVDKARAEKGSQINYTTTLSNSGINAVTGLNRLTLTITTTGVQLSEVDITNATGATIVKNAATQGDPSINPFKAVYVYSITHFPERGDLTLNYKGNITTEEITDAINTVELRASDVDFVHPIKPDLTSSTVSTRIIKQTNLKVVTTVDKTDDKLIGNKLLYTTRITNSGNNNVTSAILSIEKDGVKIIPEIFTMTPNTISTGKTKVTVIPNKSTAGRHEFTITNFPKGGAITLAYTSTIIAGSHSAVNKTTIAADPEFYRETNSKDNVSAAQTFIKPTLIQPKGITTCPGDPIAYTMESDNPMFTKFTWASIASASTIHVHDPAGTGAIKGIIENRTLTGGTISYTITPTITAPIISPDGEVSTAFKTTTGDPKTLTVILQNAAKKPRAGARNTILKYKEKVVLTPRSRPSTFPSPKYHWYRNANKTKPVFTGTAKTLGEGGSTANVPIKATIGNDGVLTVENLLPGTYTYYVAASNHDHCESELSLPVTITIASIPILTPPNVVTSSTDYIWRIPNIEQYPHYIVKIFDRQGCLIYNVNNAGDYYNNPFNGNNHPFGQYYYVIDSKDGSSTPITGPLSILKDKD